MHMNSALKPSRIIRKSNQGFTMIEVLIALLVLTIGLLGMAGLQIVSMQSSVSGLSRSQATMLAYDLAERMRRNPEAALADGYAVIALDEDNNQLAAPDSPECLTAGCTTNQLAEQDVREWLDNITDITGIGLDGNNWQPALAETTAELSRDGNDFTLLMQWNESDQASREVVSRSYEMRFTL